MNRPLFPTTLSIPSNDIGKYVGLRTYHYPLEYGGFRRGFLGFQEFFIASVQEL